MGNPKGILITSLLILLPTIWLIVRLNTINATMVDVSGDFKEITEDINKVVDQYIEDANNSTVYQSGEQTSGEYKSSRYGNPISKLIENAKISDDSTIIYEEPSEDSNPVGSIKKDVLFTVQDYDNGWSQIKFENTAGWVKSSFVIKPDDNSSSAIQSAVGKSGTVIVDSLNLRGAATTVGDPIDQLSFGDKFKVLDENADGTWYNIQCGTKNGWIKGDAKFVQIDYNS